MSGMLRKEYLREICGWTENRATWNRGARGVLTQIQDMETSLVFPILGFDCDNGSEFLNYHLFRYWTGRNSPVSFTRGRGNPNILSGPQNGGRSGNTESNRH